MKLNDVVRREIIADHTEYMRQVLHASGENEQVVDKILFHYATAMAHGWKHGFDEAAKESSHEYDE